LEAVYVGAIALAEIGRTAKANPAARVETTINSRRVNSFTIRSAEAAVPMEIEVFVYSENPPPPQKFLLRDFLEALQEAQKLLAEY